MLQILPHTTGFVIPDRQGTGEEKEGDGREEDEIQLQPHHIQAWTGHRCQNETQVQRAKVEVA